MLPFVPSKALFCSFAAFGVLALLAPSADAAEPILVPTFTSYTPNEFAITLMLQEQVTQRLLDDGHIVLSSEVVTPVVGAAAIQDCVSAPACPRDVLPKLPSRVALVVGIGRVNGTLTGHFELWEQSRPNPVESRDIVIAPGNEADFVEEVARSATNLLAVLEPSPDAVILAAARLIGGQPMTVAPAPVIVPAPQPYPGQPAQPYPGQPVAGQPYPGQPAQPYPGQPAQPYPGQPVQPYPGQPAQPYPGQPAAAQPYPGQPYPGQPAQPYPGQQAATQPYPGQPYPGQPAQPYPGQQAATQPYPGQQVAGQPGQPYPGQPVAGQPGQPVPGQVAPGQPKPAGTKAKAVPQRPTTDVRATGGGAHTLPTRELLEGTGIAMRHLVGAEGSFRNSGLDPRDWLFKATPHGGRLVVDLHGGIGIGDTDRASDMRVERDTDGTELIQWYQEGPLAARRIRGGLFVGYAPAAFLDLGVLLGMQYGQRLYSTGVRQNQPGGGVDELVEPRRPVQAVQFIAQPRVRFFLAPTGPVKPFVYGGADFRVFDRYKLQQPEGYTYATPPGGFVPGVTGGGGLMIDPSPIVGFFVEGGYIRHFGIRSVAAENTAWPYERPEPPNGGRSTISVTGGLQFRL